MVQSSTHSRTAWALKETCPHGRTWLRRAAMSGCNTWTLADPSNLRTAISEGDRGNCDLWSPQTSWCRALGRCWCAAENPGNGHLDW
mmetsp:Transcript_64533/g.144919  ORF Transcript_64533/g.144919 Transcript_64533/m.144919 type:complete len:87 (-) Transcript_64533:780-1040(-)